MSTADHSDDHLHELEIRRRRERQAVDEAGGGVAEGFELAEQELIDHASHGDQHNTMPILRDAREEAEPDPGVYGEADCEHHED